MRSLLQRVLAIVAAAAAFAAHAGGPLGVCYGNGVKYASAGTVTLNYDRGNLGSRVKTTADALVTNAVALWTNVPTATVTFSRGTDLPVDVTTANYATYLNNFSDGINPVVYDTDGSITDLLLGAGAHNNVLGFAGSAWTNNGSLCQYVEGRATINGAIAVSDATMTTVLAHEMGHLIGLDHTQLDGAQGLTTSNYPLMYPIAYRTSASLHEDDVAAVSALYPDATVATTYGTLTGTFVTAGGTPIRGANIWAQGAAGTFSVVSDYLEQGTGFFKLLLPPGTYTLHAEAIDTSFTGGSSVGPYSEDLTGLSFQAPLYSGSTPMANVTMTPTISMSAGCNASVTFSITGTGTMGASCTTPSVITSPAAGSVLAGSSVTFTWTLGTGSITDRYLMVGTTLGAQDIYGGYQGTGTSRAVSGIPTNGSTIYVRLMSLISGAWQTRDYTYTAATVVTPSRSSILTPAPGSTLPGETVTFTWDAGNGVTARFLSIGTTLGGSQIYGADQGSALSRTVSGLPTNGSTVYVRLTSTIGGVGQSYDYTYTAIVVAAPYAKSTITSPLNGSTLSGANVTFGWTAGNGVTERYFTVGSSPGAADIYGGYQGGATSRAVTGIPTDGRTIYVTLSSWITSSWQAASYTYTASGTPSGPAPTPTKSNMTSPAAGSTLSGASVTFQWDAGVAVSERYLAVGTTAGASNIFGGYQGAALSKTVTGIPTDGSTIYVTLSSWMGSGWQSSSYTYIAASGGGAPPASPSSVITSPAAGSTLGTSATFTWTAGTGVTERYLMVGTSSGGADIYQGYQGAALSRLVSGLPTGSRTVYVRLMSYISGSWVINNYTYTSAP